MLKELDTTSFTSALATGAWLVDFWSPSCGPCRRLLPALEALAETYNVAKVNCADHPDLAVEHNITAVPTLIFYKNGQEMRRVQGVQSQDELKKVLDLIQ